MNVTSTSKDVGAKLIYLDAISADKTSSIPFAKLKGLAEESMLKTYPDAAIVRPSLVLGPGDSGFFNVRTLCSDVTGVMLNVSLEIGSALGNLTSSSRIWRTHGEARFLPVYGGWGP